MDLDFLYIDNNVGYLTKNERDFSNLYTSVRTKEHRILTDQEVLQLPKTQRSNANAHEWKLRVKSTQRFTTYLQHKKTPLTILDIGCGNGWFTNKMASVNDKNTAIGVDINTPELAQAARLFNSKNLQFVYADIFKTESFNAQFNLITLNACVQYFPNFEELLSRVTSFLKPQGEVHIIDSPFYKNHDIHDARKRTETYYTDLGFPDMANNYFHHSKSYLKDFEVLYNPKKTVLSQLLNIKDSPFCWYRLVINS